MKFFINLFKKNKLIIFLIILLFIVIFIFFYSIKQEENKKYDENLQLNEEEQKNEFKNLFSEIEYEFKKKDLKKIILDSFKFNDIEKTNKILNLEIILELNNKIDFFFNKETGEIFWDKIRLNININKKFIENFKSWIFNLEKINENIQIELMYEKIEEEYFENIKKKTKVLTILRAKNKNGEDLEEEEKLKLLGLNVFGNILTTKDFNYKNGDILNLRKIKNLYKLQRIFSWTKQIGLDFYKQKIGEEIILKWKNENWKEKIKYIDEKYEKLSFFKKEKELWDDFKKKTINLEGIKNLILIKNFSFFIKKFEDGLSLSEFKRTLNELERETEDQKYSSNLVLKIKNLLKKYEEQEENHEFKKDLESFFNEFKFKEIIKNLLFENALTKYKDEVFLKFFNELDKDLEKNKNNFYNFLLLDELQQFQTFYDEIISNKALIDKCIYFFSDLKDDFIKKFKLESNLDIYVDGFSFKSKKEIDYDGVYKYNFELIWNSNSSFDIQVKDFVIGEVEIIYDETNNKIKNIEINFEKAINENYEFNSWSVYNFKTWIQNFENFKKFESFKTKFEEKYKFILTTINSGKKLFESKKEIDYGGGYKYKFGLIWNSNFSFDIQVTSFVIGEVEIIYDETNNKIKNIEINFEKAINENYEFNSWPVYNFKTWIDNFNNKK